MSVEPTSFDEVDVRGGGGETLEMTPHWDISAMWGGVLLPPSGKNPTEVG